jgi:hypothetical protein
VRTAWPLFMITMPVAVDGETAFPEFADGVLVSAVVIAAGRLAVAVPLRWW